MSQDPIIRDVKNTFESIPNDEITCKCCGALYIRGDWNFYNLCDPCFNVFDTQKMRGRWALAGQFLSTGSLKPVSTSSVEDVDEFIKARVCPHKENDFE